MDDDVRADTEVLQAHALLDGAEVVAQVQAPGGPVAREHGVFLRVYGQIGLDLVADLLGGEEGVARQIACHGGGSSLSRAPFQGGRLRH